MDVMPAGRLPCERVLVVDDNADMVASMKDVLELGGARVVTATSRAEADRVLAQGFDPNVVVLDVRLGGDRGDEYARVLQAARPALAIVLVSGDDHELRRVGDTVDATIAKPFQIERLYDTLAELCAQNRSA